MLGGALSGNEGFLYDEQNDCYICRNNKILKRSGRVVDDGIGHAVKKYFSLQSDCNNCPLRKSCISDTAKTKKVQHSAFVRQSNCKLGIDKQKILSEQQTKTLVSS